MRRLLLILPAVLALGACQTIPPRTVVVFFTADSAQLDENAQENVRQAAMTSGRGPIRVLGFAAPDSGTPQFNSALARTRAQAVADGLKANGVAAERISMTSRGAVPFELFPRESRRVEIHLGE